MSTYKKEAVLTIGFFVLYLLMAHTAPWAIILGTDNSVRVLGYPLHYFVAIAVGWFGVLGVSIAWNYMADKLDDEITSGTQEFDEEGGIKTPSTGSGANEPEPVRGKSL